MTDAELLTLADREAEFLSSENNHCASAIMRALAERLRKLRFNPEVSRDDRDFSDE